MSDKNTLSSYDVISMIWGKILPISVEGSRGSEQAGNRGSDTAEGDRSGDTAEGDRGGDTAEGDRGADTAAAIFYF